MAGPLSLHAAAPPDPIGILKLQVMVMVIESVYATTRCFVPYTNIDGRPKFGCVLRDMPSARVRQRISHDRWHERFDSRMIGPGGFG